MTKKSKFQTALQMVFPSRCVACGALVEGDFGLCSLCWAQTPFLGGAQCDFCGISVLAESVEDQLTCDACQSVPRPWVKGAAALSYEGVARKLVLALKHGDRQDIALPCSKWMASAGRELWEAEAIVVPVPLHWSRLLKRRYNQAGVLAKRVARHLDLAFCPDALLRPRVRGTTAGLTTEERFDKMSGAIEPHPKRGQRLAGRRTIVVDDVMTSGATLTAAAQAALQAGAKDVCVLTLARVAKGD
ncbi:Predicted amidophosphoribosyltransferases [Shimia haliotis]|uniref:Predicted amidophosphoribosyltransferases n=1 Tax=Shimia haliotis TaxID=1280847 RepID=A0A1I4EN10_9RHOB|nr:double zinc ribbon domain-containing protein [Shimia haliotis]SFL05866.1 Predicted amidophosphoribosyltransferases [Shimia haliotis]